MILGITGASGQLAASVLKHLLADDASVPIVAVTRSPDKVQASGPHLQVRKGDFNEDASLVAAFKGVDRLLLIPGSDLVPDVRPRQHRAAVQAAVAAGVKQIIYVSSIGVRPGPPDGILETHYATDEAVIGSGVPWTLIRMNVYADSQLDGLKRAIASGTYPAAAGAPAAYVVRDDLGRLAAKVLSTDGHAGMTYYATGPVSVSAAQLAEAASRASGKPVTFTPLTPDEARNGLKAAGLPPILVDVIGRFQQAMRDGAFDLVSGDIGRLTGRAPQLATDFIAQALRNA